MRSRRHTAEHQAAVQRRLELLSAELAAVRPAADGTPWWDGHTRISRGRPGSRAELSVVPDEPGPRPPPPPGDPLPSKVPRPGRHAARRGDRTGWLPDTLRGRLLLGPAQLAVVTVLVAIGLAGTCWWLVRGEADPVDVVTAAPASPLAPVATAPAEAAVSAPARVTVDVAGKVRRPGIAVLDHGARVVDALAAAGGARPGVDLTGLNLARVLVDGEQVVVGLPAPAGAAAAAVPSPGTPTGPLVDLNTATAAELETLPEVGPVTAAAILDWRVQHGGFTSIDELLEVDGIGDTTLGRIAPLVTL